MSHWPLVHNRAYRAKAHFGAVRAGTIVRFDRYVFSHYDQCYFYSFYRLPSEESLDVEWKRREPESLVEFFEPLQPEPYELLWSQSFPFDLRVETQLKVIGIGADDAACPRAVIRYLSFRGNRPQCFFHDHWPSADWPAGAHRLHDSICVRLGETIRCDPNVLADLPGLERDPIYRDGPPHHWVTLRSPHPFLQHEG